MSVVNVRRDVTDPFYRYKMDRLQAKIEGKGNGIKTVIVNLNTVAQSLGRPPAYLIKYFGFELGAQANTKATDDRWIINGAHDANKLQDYLDGFIQKFVLCKKCKNPETVVHIKDGRIILDCKACGERSDVDGRLKLSGFILKNEAGAGKKGGSSKKERREKKSRRDRNNERQAAGGAAGGDSSDEKNGGGDDDGAASPSAVPDEDEALAAGSDDEFTRQIKTEAEAIEQDKEIKDDDWTVDVSAEAVARRAKELPSDLQHALNLNGAAGGADGADGDDDAGAAGETAYDQLGSWVLEQAAGSAGGVAGVSDVDVYRRCLDLGIEAKSKTLTVLAQTLFDAQVVKAKQVAARAGLLRKLVSVVADSGAGSGSGSGGERAQKALLGGLERLVGNIHPPLMPQLPAILLACYQEEIIEEDVVKAWGSRASKKYTDISTSKKVRKAAVPFLEWLENAESDDEEEESGEEDSE
ncbi:hypothetical protein KEM52_000978 [Ascosphaera acerosa]|nr:hypothetical protein KEM52_000978 [Ascosphaera acerosa]